LKFVKRILLFIILISEVLHAQNKYGFVAEYNVQMMKFQLKGVLVGGADQTVYFFSKYSEDPKDNVFDNPQININPYYLYIYENHNNIMYQAISYGSMRKLKTDEVKLSFEYLPDINWKLENESKNILGYNCNKATAVFRGRKFIAWYTTEVMTAFFPWKFKGLPGLILEYYDEGNDFSAEITKIVHNRAVPADFEERIDRYLVKYKKKAISYKEDIEYDNEWRANKRNRELASLPMGTQTLPVSLRESCIEKSFEWEETK